MMSVCVFLRMCAPHVYGTKLLLKPNGYIKGFHLLKSPQAKGMDDSLPKWNAPQNLTSCGLTMTNSSSRSGELGASQQDLQFRCFQGNSSNDIFLVIDWCDRFLQEVLLLLEFLNFEACQLQMLSVLPNLTIRASLPLPSLHWGRAQPGQRKALDWQYSHPTPDSNVEARHSK